MMVNNNISILFRKAVFCRHNRNSIYPRVCAGTFFAAAKGSVRSLLSLAQDPPSNIPERPCTLILAEDIGVIHGVRSISDGSWDKEFRDKVPNTYGIPYREWTLSERRTLESSFDGALTELKEDLGRQQGAVLVTRGPWMSWMAQFYLESLPLAGLVLVDPLPFDDDAACLLFQRQYKQHYYPGNDRPTPDFTLSREYALFNDYSNHFDHWTLRLEPGVVPMMVLATSNAVWEQEHSEQMLAFQLEFAQATAQRHSVVSSTAASGGGGGGGDRRNQRVPLVKIDSCNRDACAKTICDWIEAEIL